MNFGMALIQIVLVVLKVLHLLNLHWAIILLPLELSLAVSFLVFGFIVLVALLQFAIGVLEIYRK